MQRSILASLLFFVVFPAYAQEEPVSRRDGFMLIWEAIKRPAEGTSETPFSDLAEGERGFAVITYAKARGILEDDASFSPDSPLALEDALLWLFRSRNVEPINVETEEVLSEIVDREDITLVLSRYPLIAYPQPEKLLTRDELIALTGSLDVKLAEEEHEVSLYSEKFHGKGTAFGETFDMHDLTAAHRTFPNNTLAKVTNVENGKSVIVRVNDRGPFVVGRDMDLSLAAFTTIAERSKGVIRARIERLGDASIISPDAVCRDDRLQRRISRDVILEPGVPHTLALGHTLKLSANDFFGVQRITYPDGTVQTVRQWVSPDSERTTKEYYEFTPQELGTYEFYVRTRKRGRTMRMEVIECIS